MLCQAQYKSMGTPTKPNSVSNNTQSQVLRGKDRRVAVKLWKSVADSVARINLLKNLIKEGMGLAELEYFSKGLERCYKSSKYKSDKNSVKVKTRLMKCTMQAKLEDEQNYLRELNYKKAKLRQEICNKLVKNSRPCRRVMKKLLQIEQTRKSEMNKKYMKKLKHLKTKFRPQEDKKDHQVPEDIVEFSDCVVFDKIKFNNLTVESYEVKKIGNVELTPEEESLLKLHPKFCILENLQEYMFEQEQEAALAKLRMEAHKQAENENLDEDEIEESEEMDAKNRQVYDPIDKNYDSRRRRVTDLKECSRVTLPKPLKPQEEANLEIRKRTQLEIFRKYKRKNCNKNGEQESNLTQEQKQGLKSLQKKISEGSVIIIKTDKSSKLAATTQEEYLRMGQEHISKDKKISRQELIEMEENLNGHNRAWANIWATGKDHDHFERVISSKTTHSENLANLYLMYKDHKPGDKTRPTATGHSSNSLGLSNAVAEVLEAVACSLENRYNTISSEDMLSRIHGFNKKIKNKKPLASWGVPEPQDPALSELRKQEIPRQETPPQDRISLASWGVPEPQDPALSEKQSTQENSDLEKSRQDKQENLEDGNTQTDEGFDAKVNYQETQENLETTCTYSIVGCDVKALYPSIKSKSTGEIIRKKIEETSLKFEGFSCEKGVAYIAMNTHLTGDLDKIEHLMPIRKSGRKTSLKMSAIKPDWDPKDKFEFKTQEYTENDKKLIIARVVEIATRTLFENHAYKFGNEAYRQESGGSIGDRWTGSAAELVMQDWADSYRDILVKSEVEVLLLAGYVDDGRQATSTLPMGMRFNPDKKMFEHSEDGFQEDKKRCEQGETRHQRMARICLTAMNSINSDLEFTVETEDDFADKKLPTLDFSMWQEQDGTINHTYYQKEIKTPYVIMAKSAVSKQQLIQILANETTRRITNINKDKNPIEEYIKVLDKKTQELKNSGYNHQTAREIIMSGIRGWKARTSRKENTGQEMYRAAKKTLFTRTRKKLTSRENWYKKKTQEPQDKNCPANQTQEKLSSKPRFQNKTRITSPTLQPRQEQPKLESKEDKNKTIRAVMFVPFTKNSELAKLLRENEEKLEKMTRTKLKIVERTGIKMVDLVTRSNPWQGQDCSRENCTLCMTKMKTGKLTSQECTKRNLVYETHCLNCEETEGQKIENMEIEEQEKMDMKRKLKLYKYIGETSRSSYERGWEHYNDMLTLKSKSHMLKHAILNHPEQDISEVKFGMKVVQFCKTSFERQILESVVIQKERHDHNILNSKTEYNRCSLPRLTTQLGEQELKKYAKELEKEEDLVEKKIREMRKDRNKKRLHPTKETGNPMKRRKVNESEFVSINEIWGRPEKKSPVKSKNTEPEKEQMPPNKKRKDEINPEVEMNEINEKKWSKVDWDKVIEREDMKRKETVGPIEEQEHSWALLDLCNEWLQNNNKEWEKRKVKRQEEIEKIERLEKANRLSRKKKIEHVEKKLEIGIEKLTKHDRETYEKEEKRIRLQKLKEAKEDLWKLKGREKKLRKEEPERILEIQELIRKGEKVAEMLRRERERVENEKKIENERKEKLRKEKDTKEKLIEKQEKLKQYWSMHRWITGYIADNQEQWENLRKEQTEQARKENEEWNKLTRFKKIEKLKRKFVMSRSEPEKQDSNTELEMSKITEKNEQVNVKIAIHPNTKQDNWTKWREQENVNQQEMIEELEDYADMTLQEENLEDELDIAELADWLENQEKNNTLEQENPTSFEEQDEKSERELVEIAEQIEKDEKLSQPNLNVSKTETETNNLEKQQENITPRRKPEKQLLMEKFCFKKQPKPENKDQQTPELPKKTTPQLHTNTQRTPKQENRPKLTTRMKPDSEKKNERRKKKEQEKKTIKQLQTFWNNFAERHSSTSDTISTSRQGFDTSVSHPVNQANTPSAGRDTPISIDQNLTQNSNTRKLPDNHVMPGHVADLQRFEKGKFQNTRSGPRDLRNIK